MRSDAHRAGYRPDIDGLRMIAVMSVVLCHLGVPGFAGGYVGVDVFFVISGFLITGILARELDADRFSLLGFYERRARRILPALIVVLVAAFAGTLVLLYPDATRDFGRAALATLLFASNLYYFQAGTDYFGAAAEYSPLTHTWSLAVEEQYYILFPLLLAALHRYARRWTVLAIAGLSVLSFIAAAMLVRTDAMAAFFLPHARAWELGLGALIALRLPPLPGGARAREGLGALALLLILVPILLYDAKTPFPGIAALPTCLGTAILITLADPRRAGAAPTRVAAMLSLRPFVAIGLISYSLYLWHWPIIAFLRHRLGTTELGFTPAIAALALAMALATLSYFFVERPFRRGPPRGFGRTQIFALSGMAISGLAAAAGLLVAMGGLPGRYPAPLLAAVSLDEMREAERARCFNRSVSDGLCHFGASTAATAEAEVLLWGDSHALALMEGVARAAATAEVTGAFAGRQACPPLIGAYRADREAGPACAAFNAEILGWLDAHPQVHTVILSARWALTAEGTRAPGEAGGPAILIKEGATRSGPGQPAENFAIYGGAVEATVSALRARGRRVIIVGSVPEIGWNVPQHLARHLRWGDALPAAPGRSDVARRLARSDTLLIDLARRSGATYVSVADRLCPDVCRVAVDGKPLYFDDDHLSRLGAVFALYDTLLDIGLSR